MTAVELARLVARVRSLQRAYFRSRSTADLDTARQSERGLDVVVGEILQDRPRLMFGEIDDDDKREDQR